MQNSVNTNTVNRLKSDWFWRSEGGFWKTTDLSVEAMWHSPSCYDKLRVLERAPPHRRLCHSDELQSTSRRHVCETVWDFQTLNCRFHFCDVQIKRQFTSLACSLKDERQILVVNAHLAKLLAFKHTAISWCRLFYGIKTCFEITNSCFLALNCNRIMSVNNNHGSNRVITPLREPMFNILKKMPPKIKEKNVCLFLVKLENLCSLPIRCY